MNSFSVTRFLLSVKNNLCNQIYKNDLRQLSDIAEVTNSCELHSLLEKKNAAVTSNFEATVSPIIT